MIKMDEFEARSVRCAQCYALLDECPSTPGSGPCTRCGSLARTVLIFLGESLALHERIDIRQRQEGRKKPTFELRSGDDFSHKRLRWMLKERTIDRLGDRYREHVVDPESGEVVHHCEERLSEHYGHGDAKRRS